MSHQAPDPPGNRGPSERAASLISHAAPRPAATLRASLHRALNSLPQFLYIADDRGALEFVNEAGLAYFGKPLDEILGERWRAVVHPDDLDPVRKAIEKVLAAGGPLDFDFRLRRHDGAFRWFLARSVPSRGTNGKVSHWVGSLTDIHERKAAEVAVEDSERRFRQLVDAIPHAIWTSSPNGGTTYINRHWRDFTGLSARQTREDYGSVIHPDDLHIIVDNWQKARDTGDIFEAQYRVRRKADGQYRWHLGTAYPIRDNEARIVEWVGSATDIDDRKRAEDLTREQAERLRAALDASGTGTFRWEFATNSLTWDENLDRLFGLSHGQTARTLDQFIALVHPDDRAGVIDRCRRCKEQGADFDLEFRVIYPDGSIHWLDDHGKSLPDTSGRPACMTGDCVDITARKAAELQLRNARAEAVAASRAKDQFLAALSYELRTPLNPALQILSTLLENPALPDFLRDEVALAKRNIECETHLIDDLLDVTRITQGKLQVHRERVALHELLQHAWITCVTGQSCPAVNIAWKLHALRQHVNGDPARLRQVFGNLLKNALKFTPDDGTITIATQNVENNRIRISIADTGIGIGGEAIKRIFVPFEQGTHTIAKVFGGLGLGLAIARGIVDLHHGTISAHSEGVGKGSRFDLEFAVTDPADAPVAMRPPFPNKPTPASKRILLVEDHEDTARTMMRILKIQGHTATAARTKGEAMQCLAKAPFDAVITDLALPDGSGRDLIRQIKSEKPNLPVIALSGFGMPEDIEQSLEAGAIAHLIRPIDLNRLREALDRIESHMV